MNKNKNIIEALIQQGQIKDALKELSNLDDSLAWVNRLTLRCLRHSGQNKKALSLADKLLEKEIKDMSSLYSIALILNENKRTDDALALLSKLITENPGNIELKKSHATMLASGLTLDLAEEAFREILELNPSDAATHSQLARILCRTGRVEEGLKSFQAASMLDQNNPKYLQRLVYWSNYSDQKTPQNKSHLAKLWASRAYPKSDSGTDSWRFANPTKPLKIGFLSSDFCRHAVSFFITPLLKNINRDNFSVIAYSNVKEPDEVTESIKKHCDTWNDVANLSDDILSAQIGADQLDVLIDLNGHTANNRLSVFSQHIVPIQISWLGYPGTTGLGSMHYRFTDNVADPNPDDDKFYSEELVRLPNSFLCYEPHATAPDIKLTKGDTVRFGSFNNLAKISSTTFDAWAGVLNAIPGSTLYIKRQQLINDSAKNHIIQEFNKRGIDESRLILKTSKAKIEQHLAEYSEFDIALDTTPYNGTTTTLEALWMGKPVLTLTGDTHASRVSASILSQLDLGHLITHDIEGFIQEAINLGEKGILDSFSNTIREKMENSHLLNHKQFADDFCLAIRQKWNIWCDDLNKELKGESKIIGRNDD